jgi:hypothetical protein
VPQDWRGEFGDEGGFFQSGDDFFGHFEDGGLLVDGSAWSAVARPRGVLREERQFPFHKGGAEGR